MADTPIVTAAIKDDVPTTTIRLEFDLVGIGQDSAFAQTVLGELTSAVHSLASDTLDRFGVSATTEQNRTAAKAEADADFRRLQGHLDTHLDALAASGFDFLGNVRVDPKPGKINYRAPGSELDEALIDTARRAAYSETTFSASRMAAEMASRRPATVPDHISSVTVALGCALHLEIKGGHRADSEHFALTLHAGPGTAIGVPTVAVEQLRAAGLVL